MFVRRKTSKNSPKIAIQLVENIRGMEKRLNKRLSGISALL